MTRNTTGVALIGRILSHVAQGEPSTADTLADAIGAARTTTFQILRSLEKAGLVARDQKGHIAPGETAAALGFSYFELGALAEPAQALLPVLRDETDATVELVVEHGGHEIVLMQRHPAGWIAGLSEHRTAALDCTVTLHPTPVTLRLHPRREGSEGGRNAARISLTAVAEALTRSLDPPETPEAGP